MPTKVSHLSLKEVRKTTGVLHELNFLLLQNTTYIYGPGHVR